MKFTKSFLGVRKTLWPCILGLVLLILLSVFAVHAHATEATGWVEVRANVPDGFSSNIIVGIQDTETYQDYAARVIQANNYIARFQVPAGNYALVGAFLENGDYRYNTVLINGPSEFRIQGNQTDAAIVLEFETTFNEAYSETTEEPTQEPTMTEPVPDDTTVEPTEDKGAELPTEPPTESVTEEATAPSETDTPDPSEEPGDQDKEEESGLSGWKKLLYSFLSTAVFVGVIFLAAYLYRRHIELS